MYGNKIHSLFYRNLNHSVQTMIDILGHEEKKILPKQMIVIVGIWIETTLVQFLMR